ncbi:MAG TPA: hypothetical protein VMY37_03575 [Thermoguttaceae bacterium]|nr:hypothetical protein [Thermoguttaceae bacterium]
MTSFVDSWQYTSLLDIARSHRDAIDDERITPEGVIGVDNHNRLMVSTVFSAITIEAALNDYTLIHCNFLDVPYLQGIFGDIASDYLRGSIHKKIDLLRRHWPDEIPSEVIKEVKELIRIRNRIAHQTGEFVRSFKSDTGDAVMTNRPLTGDEMLHMLRHYDIAYDFLSRFWLPGSRELASRRQPQTR